MSWYIAKYQEQKHVNIHMAKILKISKIKYIYEQKWNENKVTYLPIYISFLSLSLANNEEVKINKFYSHLIWYDNSDGMTKLSCFTSVASLKKLTNLAMLSTSEDLSEEANSNEQEGSTTIHAHHCLYTRVHCWSSIHMAS